ncbi:MAG: hypothetical protein ACJASZ_002860 [Yoonia sp.]
MRTSAVFIFIAVTAAEAAISIRKPSFEDPAATAVGIDEKIAIVFVRPVRILRAAKFGIYPSSRIAVSMRLRVSSSTLRFLLMAFETVPGETPAARATSITVTRFVGVRGCSFISVSPFL